MTKAMVLDLLTPLMSEIVPHVAPDTVPHMQHGEETIWERLVYFFLEILTITIILHEFIFPYKILHS